MGERLICGLVQVYTGSGKGKTTAALGLAYRAIGHGFKVCMIQFLKGHSYCGELYTTQLLKPYIDFYQFGKDCPYSSLIRQGLFACADCRENCFINLAGDAEEKKLALKAYDFAKKALGSGKYDLVILDEINNALRFDFIPVAKVLELIKNKPSFVELILTGRGMPPEILQAADLVSEINALKHPYEKGIKSRRGIEY
ncbi:MAG TPA: cob(I)yrinic acid a,c-diamide adenosyltransferase [Firmicutes bacterium]|nr:cob(I)yrinic acid a,c-diamide adenosyltransferase [Bacillota bacterium]